MENNKSGYIDVNEGRIQDDEQVYFSAECSSKEKFIAFISIMLSAGLVFGFLLRKLAGPIPFTVGVIIAALICVILFSYYAARLKKRHVVVTERKFLAYLKMTFWFTYDEVFACKVSRGPLDLLFGTGTVVVEVMHTWSNSQTGQIIRQERGIMVLYDVKNPHGFAASLTSAKNDFIAALEKQAKDARENRR